MARLRAEDIDALRMPPTSPYGDPRGMVDPAALQAAAWGTDYDIQARRDAIARALLAQIAAAQQSAQPSQPSVSQLQPGMPDYRVGDRGTQAGPDRTPGQGTQPLGQMLNLPDRYFEDTPPAPPNAPPPSVPVDVPVAPTQTQTQTQTPTTTQTQTPTPTTTPDVTKSGIPAGERSPSMMGDQFAHGAPPAGNMFGERGGFTLFGDPVDPDQGNLPENATPTMTDDQALTDAAIANAAQNAPTTPSADKASMAAARAGYDFGIPSDTIVAPGGALVSPGAPATPGWGGYTAGLPSSTSTTTTATGQPDFSGSATGGKGGPGKGGSEGAMAAAQAAAAAAALTAPGYTPAANTMPAPSDYDFTSPNTGPFEPGGGYSPAAAAQAGAQSAQSNQGGYTGFGGFGGKGGLGDLVGNSMAAPGAPGGPALGGFTSGGPGRGGSEGAMAAQAAAAQAATGIPAGFADLVTAPGAPPAGWDAPDSTPSGWDVSLADLADLSEAEAAATDNEGDGDGDGDGNGNGGDD